eukprot:Sdes_comp23176_c0_seq1m21478
MVPGLYTKQVPVSLMTVCDPFVSKSNSFSKFTSYSQRPGSSDCERICAIFIGLPERVDKTKRCRKQVAPSNESTDDMVSCPADFEPQLLLFLLFLQRDSRSLLALLCLPPSQLWLRQVIIIICAVHSA